jgi:hypothetical protein
MQAKDLIQGVAPMCFVVHCYETVHLTATKGKTQNGYNAKTKTTNHIP